MCGGRAQKVDLLRKRKIQKGKAPFAVRGKPERHFVPPDIDIRMMLCLLGERSHSVHKSKCSREIGQFKNPVDFLSFQSPLRNRIFVCL